MFVYVCGFKEPEQEVIGMVFTRDKGVTTQFHFWVQLFVRVLTD